MTRGQLRDAKGRWMRTGLSFALRCLRSGRDRARMWALHLQAEGEYEGKPKNRGERRMAEGKRRATLMGSLSVSSFKLVTVGSLVTGAFAAFVTFLGAGRSGGSVELSLFRSGFRVVVFLGAGRDVVAAVVAFAFDAARVVRVVAGTLFVAVFERVLVRVAVALLAIAVQQVR